MVWRKGKEGCLGMMFSHIQVSSALRCVLRSQVFFSSQAMALDHTIRIWRFYKLVLMTDLLSASGSLT